MTETTVVQVLESSSKKARVVLADSLFHCAGGGQPGDSGVLTGADFSAVVENCRKEGSLHVLDLTLKKGSPAEGLVVTAQVDEKRHETLSKMHSAQHILSRILERDCPGLSTVKVAVDVNHTTVFFHCAEPLTWEILWEAEEKANKIVAQHLPVTIRQLSLEEAKGLSQLRAKWERIADETIRIVEIQDFDCIACSGSHVSHTGEIGGIFIESFRGGDWQWEVVLSLAEAGTECRYGRILRQVLQDLHCKPEELPKVLARLHDESRSLQKQLDKLRPYIQFPHEELAVQNRPLCCFALTGVSREMVMPRLSALSASRPEALVLALLDDGESAKIPFVLLCGASIKADARLLKNDSSLSIQGGGSPAMLSGLTGCRSVTHWCEALETWFGSSQSGD